MLTVQQTMELTKKLMAEGISDTTEWINSHPDEECLAYLNNEVVVITRPANWASGICTECSPDIKEWCTNHGIEVKDFNQPVTISSKLASCNFLFAGCQSFNQPVTIPDGITSCLRMFQGCKSFNQPIEIPSSVTNCDGMFRGCKTFNQPVTIPDGVTECIGMFYACEKFDHPITLPNSVTNCSYMFLGCKSFNQPITIPDSVADCIEMFEECTNMKSLVAAPSRLKSQLETSTRKISITDGIKSLAQKLRLS